MSDNPTLTRPSRAVLFRVIGNAAIRHKIVFIKPTREILDVVKTADYDLLVELAFFAMSDIGNEITHKQLFLDKCKVLGIE